MEQKQRLNLQKMEQKQQLNFQETLAFYDTLATETPGMEITYRTFRKVIEQLFESRMDDLRHLFVGTSHSTLCIGGTPQETTAIPGTTLKIVPSRSALPAKIELEYRFNIGDVQHTLIHAVHPRVEDFLVQFDKCFREFQEFRAAVGKLPAITF